MKLSYETKEQIEFNEPFKQAYDALEHGNKNVFITGKAGTGKSTLLRIFVDNTSKNVAVLAPTGVAAINIKGQTVHSFFKFRPDITPHSVSAIKLRKKARELYKKLDTVVIDEISMVRADLLDCVDQFLRIHGKYPGVPFGGAQMVFFGDLFQLSPVVTSYERELFNGHYKSPFFFDSHVFNEILALNDHPRRFHTLELKKIYRQKEQQFVQLLSMIRNKTITQEYLNKLNERFSPDFAPRSDDFYIYLTTTNKMADTINQRCLNQLKSGEYIFDGEIEGNFDQKNLPTHQSLKLKSGAQVMLLNNDSQGRWINGSIGRVLGVNEIEESVEVELSDGDIVEVTPFTWEMYRFFYNEEDQKLESESIGAFKQLPLKLSWAVTIHKSQGKTFSHVIVDIGYGTFSHGQVYVALSRCTSFEGLILKRKIEKRHILLDNRIQEFMQNGLAIE